MHQSLSRRGWITKTLTTLALLALPADACLGQSSDDRGDGNNLPDGFRGTYVRGTYGAGSDPIRMFAFAYQGTLEFDRIRGQVGDIVRELDAADLTAKPSGLRWLTQMEPTHFRRGEIFIFGFYIPTQKTVSWMAFNRSDDAYPVHECLLHTNRKGKMINEGAEQICQQLFAVGQNRITMQIRADAGWIRWAADGLPK